MGIVSATIEPTGDILAIRFTGAAGQFSDYALEPDTNRRVIVQTYHAGHTQRAGQLVPTQVKRMLAATVPLRKPVNPLLPYLPFVDETDLGDNTRLVRLALEETIYATDAGVRLSVAIGWRSNEQPAIGQVTNRSVIVAPMPIFRWADVTGQEQSGSFVLELFAASHHPMGNQGLAGVRFTITDGSSVDSFWALSLSTSLSYKDNLRCYRARVDPSRAAAFRAGLLRCDAEAYPWIGSVRSTGPNLPHAIGGSGGGGFQAKMQPMDNLVSASYATAAEAPFTVAWNPGKTRYPPAFVYVDHLLGLTDASAVKLSSDAGIAAAGPFARDVTTAMQAVFLAKRSAPPANGQPAILNMADGAVIRLRAGTHVDLGTTNVDRSLTAGETWPIVEGDPADPDPRSNVILQTNTDSGLSVGSAQFRNMSVELGQFPLDYYFTRYWWFNNLEMRGKAGQDQNAKPPISPNEGHVFYTGTRFWKYGFSMRWALSHQPHLIRGCEASRRMEAPLILTSRWIAALDPTVTNIPNASGELYAVGGWQNIPDAGSQQDVIHAFNTLLSTRDRTWHPVSLSAELAGTRLRSIRRQVFLGNLTERVAPTGGDTNWAIGEEELVEMSYNIIEGNTIVGERANLLYNNPPMKTLADCDTLNSIGYVNRYANNATDKVGTKHDDFDDPTTRSIRTAAGALNSTGFRPQDVSAWSSLNGVGFESNYDFNRKISNAFHFRYFGINSFQADGSGPTGYVNDRSIMGSGAGQGDYRPCYGSPLIGKARRANFDVDLHGVLRGLTFAIGCLEP